MSEYVFETKPKTVKVKIDGNEYLIRLPKISESKLLRKQLSEAKDKDADEYYIPFFVNHPHSIAQSKRSAKLRN